MIHKLNREEKQRNKENYRQHKTNAGSAAYGLLNELTAINGCSIGSCVKKCVSKIIFSGKYREWVREEQRCCRAETPTNSSIIAPISGD